LIVTGVQTCALPILATNNTSGTIDYFRYTYDSADRLTSETDTQNGATTTTTYGYDSSGQLTSAITGATTLSYGYDNNGNRNTGKIGRASCRERGKQR